MLTYAGASVLLSLEPVLSAIGLACNGTQPCGGGTLCSTACVCDKAAVDGQFGGLGLYRATVCAFLGLYIIDGQIQPFTPQEQSLLPDLVQEYKY